MGCERNPKGLIAAAAIRPRRAFRDAVAKYKEHSRNLIHACVQTDAIGRRQHSKVSREKYLVVEFTR